MNDIPATEDFSIETEIASLRDRIAFAETVDKTLAPAANSPKEKPAPTASPQSEIARLNTTIDRLYEQKRREMLDLELTYSRERQEMTERRRVLDRTFEADHQRLCEFVRRLEAMRE